MTSREAFAAIGEMLSTSKDADQIVHLHELSDKILEQEVPLNETDRDLEHEWWDHTHED